MFKKLLLAALVAFGFAFTAPVISTPAEAGVKIYVGHGHHGYHKKRYYRHHYGKKRYYKKHRRYYKPRAYYYRHHYRPHRYYKKRYHHRRKHGGFRIYFGH